MVIYSTLIEAATEHVEIFGKAGSTTIREIKIENPQDSTIVLFVEKVSFFLPESGVKFQYEEARIRFQSKNRIALLIEIA